MGLIVTNELRHCPRNVGPFRESLTPPFIVFRNWMKLRKIKGNQAYTKLASIKCLHGLRNIIHSLFQFRCAAPEEILQINVFLAPRSASRVLMESSASQRR